MSELIEHGDDNNSTVRIGEGDRVSDVSVKVYQDVYHQVTGRTEQIRKRYDESLLITAQEIEQLHHKIMQLCDVHNVIARNETISIFHEKERKEQFTSFERFTAYNANAASPTVSMVLKYHFSILLPELKRPQEYTITIQLSSRVAMIKQLQEDASPFFPSELLAVMVSNTAEVNVEYADYVVARSFVEAVDEWVKGCDSTPDNKLMRRLKRISHFIPKIAGPAIALSTVYFSLQSFAAGDFTGAQTVDLAQFTAVYIAGLYVLVNLAGVAGKLIERAIDRHTELSYIQLNRGDKKLTSEFGKRSSRSVVEFVGGCLLTVTLGVISTKLAGFI